ncbi:insulin-like growth factor 2 mRNA-binding protein 2 [Nematostella vectensis]|uniref:insulin-like growth factor 2 mRNA-binding protein 2 n=1 Tax=Nematostella vectensis TaxID=45351 RepID=UPI0020775D20|nr:insulin-like growth factor 2 mRNA-binding protein 2 [Nematostella vectensis]
MDFEGHDDNQMVVPGMPSIQYADGGMHAGEFTYISPEENMAGGQSPPGHDDGREAKNGGAKHKPRGARGRPMKEADYSIRMLIPCKMVGAVIGTSGNKIKKITEATNTSIDIHRKEDRREVDKLVTIRGSPQDCSNANMQIHQLMREETDANLRSNEVEMRLVIHDSHAGRIIGRKGNNLKSVMDETGASSIKVSGNTGDRMGHSSMLNPGDRIVSIKCLIHDESDGEKAVDEDEAFENCMKAECMISGKVHECLKKDMDDLVRSKQMQQPFYQQQMHWNQGQGYGGGMPPAHMMPDNAGGMMNVSQYPYQQAPQQFHQHVSQPIRARLAIPQKYAGAVIGTKGSFCNYMKTLSGASRVHVSPDDKSGERYVEVIGHPMAQYFAQHCVYCKLAEQGYSNSDGELKLRAEVTVPIKGAVRGNKEQQTNIIGKIIGKGGQNVKNLEKETRTYIKIVTDEQDPDPKEAVVQIVGSFASSQHAQYRINEIVNQCQQGGPMNNYQGAGPKRPPPPPAPAAPPAPQMN